MHDRFTSSGRRTVELAGEEARCLGHNYVGTEHLLLGLLREQGGFAARVLEALDVAPERVREQVICMVGSYEAGAEARRPLTPRARRVLELALEEALRLGGNHVGAEHILLGLVREPKGVAALALYKFGANPDRVRHEMAQMLGDQEQVAEGTGCATGSPSTRTFRARVEGLIVHVRCGVTNEERALTQTLRVDLDYLYEAGEGDDLYGTVDYGALIECVARLLEREEFRLLETGARMVGEHVLDRFPSVREVAIAITKPKVPVAHEVSGVSVEATFVR